MKVSGRTIRMAVLPAALALLAATVFAADHPKTTTAHSSAQQAARPAAETQTPADASNAGQHVNIPNADAKITAQWVTWDYYRMNHPEVIVGMLHAVKTGALDKSALNGLAPQAQLNTMLKHNWKPTTAARGLTPPDINAPKSKQVFDNTVTPGASQVVGPNSAAVAGASTTSWQKITGHETSHVLIPTEAQPAQLNFGSEYAGQSRSMDVLLTALGDGQAHARLPKGSPFEIVRLTTYSGTIEVRAGGSGQRLSGAMTTVRLPEKVINKAPWSVPVRAGQDVSVTVRFAPTRQGPPEGAVTDGLEFSAGGGLASVPLNAKCLGVKFGIDASCTLGSVDLLPGADFQIPLALNNAGIKSTISMITTGLPRGIAVDPFSATLQKGEARNVYLNCHAGNEAEAAAGQIVTLRCTNGDVVYDLPIVINVWQPWHDFSAAIGVNGKMAVFPSIRIRADGTYDISGTVYRVWTGTGCVTRWKLTVNFNPIGEKAAASGTMGYGEENDTINSTGRFDSLQQHYTDFMQDGAGLFNFSFTATSGPS
jgi:hypothetical protein